MKDVCVGALGAWVGVVAIVVYSHTTYAVPILVASALLCILVPLFFTVFVEMQKDEKTDEDAAPPLLSNWHSESSVLDK